VGRRKRLQNPGGRLGKKKKRGAWGKGTKWPFIKVKKERRVCLYKVKEKGKRGPYSPSGQKERVKSRVNIDHKKKVGSENCRRKTTPAAQEKKGKVPEEKGGASLG